MGQAQSEDNTFFIFLFCETVPCTYWFTLFQSIISHFTFPAFPVFPSVIFMALWMAREAAGNSVSLATPSSPSKLVPVHTSFLKHQILGRKSGFLCRILCFKRQFYICSLPQWKYKLCEPHRANSSCICFGRQPPQARERRDGRRMMANPQWPLCLLSLTSCSPVPGLLMKILCAWEKHWAVLPNAGGVLHSILFMGLTQEIKTDGLW